MLAMRKQTLRWIHHCIDQITGPEIVSRRIKQITQLFKNGFIKLNATNGSSNSDDIPIDALLKFMFGGLNSAVFKGISGQFRSQVVPLNGLFEFSKIEEHFKIRNKLGSYDVVPGFFILQITEFSSRLVLL